MAAKGETRRLDLDLVAEEISDFFACASAESAAEFVVEMERSSLAFVPRLRSTLLRLAGERLLELSRGAGRG